MSWGLFTSYLGSTINCKWLRESCRTTWQRPQGQSERFFCKLVLTVEANSWSDNKEAIKLEGHDHLLILMFSKYGRSDYHNSTFLMECAEMIIADHVVADIGWQKMLSFKKCASGLIIVGYWTFEWLHIRGHGKARNTFDQQRIWAKMNKPRLRLTEGCCCLWYVYIESIR